MTGSGQLLLEYKMHISSSSSSRRTPIFYLHGDGKESKGMLQVVDRLLQRKKEIRCQHTLVVPVMEEASVSQGLV